MRIKTKTDHHVFEVEIFLNDLGPKAVRVELYADGINGGIPVRQEMKRIRQPTGASGGSIYWDIPKLRELLETILPEKTSFDNYEVEHDFATIGRRIMLLNARQIQRGMGEEQIILLAMQDVT